MPDETTILSLPLILPAQAQKHVTHNEALTQLDLIVQLAVTDRTLTAPPVAPTVGDRHIVAAGATGAWAGQAGRIAYYAEAGWQFTQALPGWQAHVLAEGQTAVYDGTVWRTLAEGDLTVARLGVGATPDATNRLAVTAPATLLNHAGDGHQLKVNKATVADTASLLFQTNFAGRAEMGTAGEDNFSIKVSPDGIDWPTALTAAVETGEVTFPAPLHLGGQDSDLVAPPDGTIWLDSLTGEVRVRSAGVTQPVGGGGGVSDGDRGDITVSGSGAVWTIDPGAVTLAKMAAIGTASFLGRNTVGSGAPEVLTPTQARGILNVADGANNYVHPNHSGDVSSTGDGATVIANNVVTNAKLADMATARIKGRSAAGTGDPQDLTGTEVTALLDVFTATEQGLAPASGGGTANFLRADGTWSAPAGGGAPGGAVGELQFNNGGAFAGVADAEVEGGQLRLPYIADPNSPAAGGLKLYGMDFGPGAPAFKLPNGRVKLVQSDLGDFNVNRVIFAPGLASSVENSLNVGATGTTTLATCAITRLHTMMPRLDVLVTTAAITAIAALRGASANAQFLRVGRDANAPGGFLLRCLWGPATGVAIATHRGFCGIGPGAAPTDVEPSSRTNVVGMGWDAADANIQFMHNDAAGTCTKIDLGPSFPVPTVDREQVYEVQLYSPNELAQSVNYRVIRYSTSNKTIAAEVSGTVSTNLPATSVLSSPLCAMSVGGTSSVIGIAVMGMLVAREY